MSCRGRDRRLVVLFMANSSPLFGCCLRNRNELLYFRPRFLVGQLPVAHPADLFDFGHGGISGMAEDGGQGIGAS